MEELEFFKDEVEFLKEVPGEEDLEEAGEEECKEEGGFGAAKGVEGGVEKDAVFSFVGVSFVFNFLFFGWIMSMYLLLYSEVAVPLILCAFLKCLTSTR